jgi:hypothetical protein
MFLAHLPNARKMTLAASTLAVASRLQKAHSGDAAIRYRTGDARCRLLLRVSIRT